MSKPLTEIYGVLVVGRVISGACGLLLSLALAGCGGTPTPQYVIDANPGVETGEATYAPAVLADIEPAAGDGAEPGAAGEARQASAPPGPLAGHPQDQSLAAGTTAQPAEPLVVFTAPEIAPQPPAKPVIDDDPKRLMGLRATELKRMLGDPRFVRRDASAQLWRYRNKTCILDLFLYRTGGRPEYSVSHVETRRSEGGSTPQRECFGALLLERLNREAG